MTRYASLVPALLGVVLCAANAQDVDVTPKEIQEQWVGKTMSGSLPNGGPVSMQLRPDGSGKVVVATIPYRGTWRLSDTGYCTAWDGIRSGQERCFTVKRSAGTWIVINPDGKEGGRFERIE